MIIEKNELNLFEDKELLSSDQIILDMETIDYIKVIAGFSNTDYWDNHFIDSILYKSRFYLRNPKSICQSKIEIGFEGMGIKNNIFYAEFIADRVEVNKILQQSLLDLIFLDKEQQEMGAT